MQARSEKAKKKALAAGCGEDKARITMKVMANGNSGRVRAFVFDLDGTLIDSKQDLVTSVNAMLRETKREEQPPEQVVGYIGHGAPQRQRSGTGVERRTTPRGAGDFSCALPAAKARCDATLPRSGRKARETCGKSPGGVEQQTCAAKRRHFGGARPGKIFSSHLRGRQLRKEEAGSGRRARDPERARNRTCDLGNGRGFGRGRANRKKCRNAGRGCELRIWTA